MLELHVDYSFKNEDVLSLGLVRDIGVDTQSIRTQAVSEHARMWLPRAAAIIGAHGIMQRGRTEVASIHFAAATAAVPAAWLTGTITVGMGKSLPPNAFTVRRRSHKDSRVICIDKRGPGRKPPVWGTCHSAIQCPSKVFRVSISKWPNRRRNSGGMLREQCAGETRF